MTVLPGVTTRSRATINKPVAEALEERPAKRPKKTEQSTTPSPPHKTPVSSPRPVQVIPSPNIAFEQWLDDISNVDISLSICVGDTPQPSEPQPTEGESAPESSAQFSVSIPTMLVKVLQAKLAIDPSRLVTTVKGENAPKSEVFVALTVKGREEPIEQAIEGL